MLATKLSKALATPTKVASILDWRKAACAVMSLDINSERIAVAIAEHPDRSDSVSTLEPIDIVKNSNNRHGALDERAISKLESLVKDHNVCAFVVNWPLQPEGRMGAPCGKVLHTLDTFVDKSNTIITNNRPFTLWDNKEVPKEVPADEWGRSPLFSRAPEYYEGMEHRSSMHVSHANGSDDASAAADVLENWIRNHYDEPPVTKVEARKSLVERAPKAAVKRKSNRKEFFFSTHSVDEYSNDQAYISPTLL